MRGRCRPRSFPIPKIVEVDRGDHLAFRGAGMAPPVEEMETRDVSLVLSDMIKYRTDDTNRS